MTAEWVAALSSLATFGVIAASAVAAMIQLRHLRGSNQIAALTEARKTADSPEFLEITRFATVELPARLNDPSVRTLVLNTSWAALPNEYRQTSIVSNFYEMLGILVKHRIIDRRLVCDMWSDRVLRLWDALAPVIVNRRIVMGNPAVLENFEYLTVLCRRWRVEYPNGAFPRNVERASDVAVWPEARAESDSI